MTEAHIQTSTPAGERETTHTGASTRSKHAGKAAPQTKKQQLVKLLSGKTGAEVATISTRLGWQRHTTRAALTGLRKAGYEIAVEKAEGKPSRYRIVGLPAKVEHD